MRTVLSTIATRAFPLHPVRFLLLVGNPGRAPVCGSGLVSTRAPGAGDETSLSLLARVYARWHQPLRRLLGRQLRNREDAEDAVQEVFVRYAASGKALPPEEQEPYLRVIARHVSHDAWHGAGGAARREMVSLDEHRQAVEQLPAAQEADPAHAAHQRERLQRLEQAMAELPARRREAFMLHSIEGLTQTEVAQRMGISRRMVYNHVTLALAYCELRVQYASAQEMRLMQALLEPLAGTDEASEGPA